LKWKLELVVALGCKSAVYRSQYDEAEELGEKGALLWNFML
jgi:hypothetical protein